MALQYVLRFVPLRGKCVVITTPGHFAVVYNRFQCLQTLAAFLGANNVTDTMRQMAARFLPMESDREAVVIDDEDVENLFVQAISVLLAEKGNQEVFVIDGGEKFH